MITSISVLLILATTAIASPLSVLPWILYFHSSELLFFCCSVIAPLRIACSTSKIENESLSISSSACSVITYWSVRIFVLITARICSSTIRSKYIRQSFQYCIAALRVWQGKNASSMSGTRSGCAATQPTLYRQSSCGKKPTAPYARPALKMTDITADLVILGIQGRAD